MWEKSRTGGCKLKIEQQMSRHYQVNYLYLNRAGQPVLNPKGNLAGTSIM